MHLTSWAVAVAATLQVASANFGEIRVPKVIAPNAPFTITGNYLLDKAGSPVTLHLGVFPFDSSTQPDYNPQVSQSAALGNTLLKPIDISK